MLKWQKLSNNKIKAKFSSCHKDKEINWSINSESYSLDLHYQALLIFKFIKMPTFDIISKIDIQKLDNAINAAVKELATRYDFNNSKSTIELDKKTMMIHVLTENDMRMKSIEGMIIGRMIKQGLDPQSLDSGKELYASGNMVKKDIKVKQGIDKETAKKLVKLIKDTGMKVQPSIMDEQVRVSGKKIDNLQELISILEKEQVGIPLQFENFRG